MELDRHVQMYAPTCRFNYRWVI